MTGDPSHSVPGSVRPGSGPGGDSGAAMNRRDGALRVVEGLRQAIASSQDRAVIFGASVSAVEALTALQAEPGDRPYLARSLCQVAGLLRRAGWIDFAVRVLTEAGAREATDEYVLCELMICHIARNDLVSAGKVIDVAHDARLSAAALYPALIAAVGRAGQCARGEALFARAVDEQCETPFIYTAMVDMYGRAGDLELASRLWRQSIERHHASAASTTALIAALARARHAAEASRVCAEGETHGACDAQSYGALIRVLLEDGRLADAHATLHRATASGHADAFTFGVTIVGLAARGHARGATALLSIAERRGMASVHAYEAVIRCLSELGQWRRVQKVRARLRALQRVAPPGTRAPGRRRARRGATQASHRQC